MATFKQQQNRKKYTKEYKVKEIQKSLTKKARLKKGYLKALKEEGYSIPDKKPKSSSSNEVEKLSTDLREKGKKKLDEKKEIKQERKRQQRALLEERRKNELESIKKAKERLEERERRKKRLSKRTRSGQPLMGPKIEDMLSKIKEDETYTR